MDEALLNKINSSFSHAKELCTDQNHSDLVTGQTTENAAFFPKIIPESVKSIAVPTSVNQRNWQDDDEVQIKLENGADSYPAGIFIINLI